jgi:hypothetical protein
MLLPLLCIVKCSRNLLLLWNDMLIKCTNCVRFHISNYREGHYIPSVTQEYTLRTRESWVRTKGTPVNEKSVCPFTYDVTIEQWKQQNWFVWLKRTACKSLLYEDFKYSLYCFGRYSNFSQLITQMNRSAVWLSYFLTLLSKVLKLGELTFIERG